MRRFETSLGRRLQSVSLRYRSPLCGENILEKPWPQALHRMSWGRGMGSQPAAAALFGGSERERLTRLEAVLFLARQPLSSRKLSQLANLADGTEARTLIRTLHQRYDARGAAFQVEEVGGGFQLLTRGQFSPWLRRLQSPPPEVRLSAPAMETLAVVAYRGPVLRAAIEAIRGVQCGEILRQLMDRDLLRIAGRAEELGRPFLYATTKRFLQVFGLRSLEELPRAEQLRATLAPGLVEQSEVENSSLGGQNIETSEASVSGLKESAEMNQDMTNPIRKELSNCELSDEERPTNVNELEDKKIDEDEYEYVDEDEDEDDEYEYVYEDGDEEEDDSEDKEKDDSEDEEKDDSEDEEEDDSEEEDDEEEYEYEEVDDLEDEDEDDDEEEDDEEDDEEWEEVDVDEEEDDEYEYEYEEEEVADDE